MSIILKTGGQNDNFCQSFEAKLEGYKHSFRKMDLHQYHHFFTQRLVVKSVAFSHLCLIIWQQGQLKIVQKCEKALFVFFALSLYACNFKKYYRYLNILLDSGS